MSLTSYDDSFDPLDFPPPDYDDYDDLLGSYPFDDLPYFENAEHAPHSSYLDVIEPYDDETYFPSDRFNDPEFEMDEMWEAWEADTSTPESIPAALSAEEMLELKLQNVQWTLPVVDGRRPNPVKMTRRGQRYRPVQDHGSAAQRDGVAQSRQG